MSAAAVVKPKKTPPKARDHSVKGTYEIFKRQQVLAAMTSKRWRFHGTDMAAHVYRITGSASKAAVIAFVEMHTGSQCVEGMTQGYDEDASESKFSLTIRQKKRGSREYSPNLTTSDFAKLGGIGRRQMQKSVSWCKEKGYVLAKGSTGEEAVQYRLDRGKIQRAKNARDPEDEARKAAARAAADENRLSASEAADNTRITDSDGAEDEANKTGTGCGTRHLQNSWIFVKPGSAPQEIVRIVDQSGETRRVLIEGEMAAKVTMSIAAHGDLVVRISASPAAEETASPAPAPPQAAAPVPAPARPSEADRLDQLSQELVRRELTCARDVLQDLVGKLKGVPIPYFVAELDRQIERARRKRGGYKKAWLAITASDAAGQWAEETKARPADQPPPEPPPLSDDARIVSHLEACAAKVEARAPEIAAELRTLAAAAQKTDDLEAIETRLQALEPALIAVAQRELQAEDAQIRAAVARRAAARGLQMGAAQFEAFEQQAYERELLKHCALPRLSLFYLGED